MPACRSSCRRCISNWHRWANQQVDHVCNTVACKVVSFQRRMHGTGKLSAVQDCTESPVMSVCCTCLPYAGA